MLGYHDIDIAKDTFTATFLCLGVQDKIISENTRTFTVD